MFLLHLFVADLITFLITFNYINYIRFPCIISEMHYAFLIISIVIINCQYTFSFLQISLLKIYCYIFIFVIYSSSLSVVQFMHKAVTYLHIYVDVGYVYLVFHIDTARYSVIILLYCYLYNGHIKIIYNY